MYKGTKSHMGIRSQQGHVFVRFIIIIALVIPLVLLATACSSGGTIGEGDGTGDGSNTTLNQQQFVESQTKCIPFEAHDTTTIGTLPVDVLWVVDNSGSMCSDQVNVAAGMANLAAALAGQNLDVHMGYVTTDFLNQAQSGQLQGAPEYITDLSQASIDTLRANIVAAGCLGDGAEYGGRAAFTALELSDAGEPNAGFLRANASLVVNILTDEDDDTYWLSGMSPSTIIDNIVARKGNDANLVTYNLIAHINPDTNPNVPPNDPCYNNGSDEVGSKYIESQNYLGTLKTNGNIAGIQADICSTDYAATIPTMLTEGVVHTTTTVTSIDLSGLGFAPYPPSIVLTLANGTEQSTGWHYDEASQEIIIDNPDLQHATGEACAHPLLGET